MKDKEASKQLAHYIDEADIICFYSGAGMSTESGISDYRSKHGIWTLMEENEQNPQYFAHADRIKENPEAFFKARKQTGPPPKPHSGHFFLADLEKAGKDIRVITQNVDGLHQKAGHRFVVELHGNYRDWYCMDCGRTYRYEEVQFDDSGVPRCYVDHGVVRPNVVYFGENADRKAIEISKRTLEMSDLLIIAGTSLTTPLAKRMVQNFKGHRIVIINKEPLDIAPLEPSLFIQCAVGEVLDDVSTYISDREE